MSPAPYLYCEDRGTVAHRCRLRDRVLGPTATWQPLGPSAVNTPHYGLVTGRVSSIAFDPADSTGNRVYLGTTGGGVWLSQNAATSNTDHVLFAPLTDALGAMSSALDASISIGAITVQPGGTGVILAGTGDPNDALDSYYGAGILRSTDGGNTWSLIATTADQEWAICGRGVCRICVEHCESTDRGGGCVPGLRRRADQCGARALELRGAVLLEG